MGRIWTDENRFRKWLEVEIAASDTLAEAGLVPSEAARAIRERGGFDVERIRQIEAEVKHDVIAFTTAVAETIGPESRWLHYGLTSNDVVDTAQALLLKDASALLLADLKQLSDVLRRRAQEFRRTPMVGRTHGSARGGRVFQREAKRLFGHAAQAQSGHLRADQRPGARGARQHASGAGECGAMARARYLTFFGGAHHPARFHHPAGLHAGQD